jgi:hypothetical protein
VVEGEYVISKNTYCMMMVADPLKKNSAGECGLHMSGRGLQFYIPWLVREPSPK